MPDTRHKMTSTARRTILFIESFVTYCLKNHFDAATAVSLHSCYHQLLQLFLIQRKLFNTEKQYNKNVKWQLF